METVLNLTWLAITLAGVWLWRFRWVTSRGNQRGRIFPEAVAIVCLLTLLLPVISLTDDLHPEVMMVECASAKRNLSVLIARGPHASYTGATRQVHSAMALLMRPLAQPGLMATNLEIDVRIPQVMSSVSIPLGRSPPFFF
jgi:hypothetical protein